MVDPAESSGEARSPRREEERLAALLALVGLVAAALVYFVTLDRHGLWFDEIRTALAVELPFGEMVAERLGHAHPPLFFALQWLLVRAVDGPDALLRVVPALFGLVSAVLLFALGRRVAGPWIGAVATLLLLVSPHHVEISQMARAYTLVQALLLTATLVLVRAERDSWRLAAAFALPATLAAWAHYSALPVIAAQALACWIAGRRRASLGGLVATFLATPFVLATSRLTTVEERVGWVDRQPGETWLDLFAYPFVRFGGALPTGGVLAVAVGVLALGIVGAAGLRRGNGLLVSVWLLPPVLLGLGALVGLPPVDEVARYLATSWAVGTLLVAASLHTHRGLRRLIPAGALAGLVALAVPQTLRYVETSTHWPARQVARIVMAHRRPSEVLVLQPRPDYYMVMAYHYDEDFYRLLPPGRRRFAEAVRGPSGGPGPDVDGIWLYSRSAYFPGRLDRPRWRALRRRLPEMEIWPVRQGTLVHFWREAGAATGETPERDDGTPAAPQDPGEQATDGR